MFAGSTNLNKSSGGYPMKQITIAVLTAALLTANLIKAQELPKVPPPVKEHEWLQKFVGDWEYETEIFMEPGKPPMKVKGTETVRSLGGFWIVSDGKSEMMGKPFTSVLTLGFDPQAKKYVGTWVDSMSSTLWKYEGSVDSTGKFLTLESEGPCPMKPGQLAKFHEVTEFKSDDERVFTSKMQGDDGKWNTILRVTSRRTK
jgi:hypothetical protein